MSVGVSSSPCKVSCTLSRCLFSGHFQHICTWMLSGPTKRKQVPELHVTKSCRKKVLFPSQIVVHVSSSFMALKIEEGPLLIPCHGFVLVPSLSNKRAHVVGCSWVQNLCVWCVFLSTVFAMFGRCCKNLICGGASSPSAHWGSSLFEEAEMQTINCSK